MKKKIIVGFLTLTTLVLPSAIYSSFSSVEQQNGYVSLGLGPCPVPLPVFGGGYRLQRGHQGFDVSAQVSTVVTVTQIKGSLLYLRYFKPDPAAQFYAGIGVSPSYLCGADKWLFSSEWVFGKQYRTDTGNQRFLQAQVSFPTAVRGDKHSTWCYYPLVVFSYGIGF